GRGGGRFRRRRVAGFVRDQLREERPVPQQRGRDIHGRDREGRSRGAELVNLRDILRLRQRRQAGPVRVELRTVQRVGQRLLRRQSPRQALLLHPARLQTATEFPVS